MVECADEHFIDICLKFQDIRLLCKVIEEFGVAMNEISAASDAMMVLMNALITLVEQNALCGPHVIDTVPVILLMSRDESYSDLLNKLLVKNIIMANIDVLGSILSHLCNAENGNNYDKLKSSINFRSILLNFIHVFQ